MYSHSIEALRHVSTCSGQASQPYETRVRLPLTCGSFDLFRTVNSTYPLLFLSFLCFSVRFVSFDVIFIFTIHHRCVALRRHLSVFCCLGRHTFYQSLLLLPPSTCISFIPRFAVFYFWSFDTSSHSIPLPGYKGASSLTSKFSFYYTSISFNPRKLCCWNQQRRPPATWIFTLYLLQSTCHS